MTVSRSRDTELGGRDGAPVGKESSECQAGVEVMDMDLLNSKVGLWVTKLATSVRGADTKVGGP